MKIIKEKARDTQVLTKCDVVVVGGGTAGLGAAVAAARNGVDVILVDYQGYFGGTSTSGMVCNFAGYLPELHGGIFKEFVGRLEDFKSITKIFNNVLNAYISFYDIEIFKYVAIQMIEESGIRPLLHTYVVDTIMEDNKIKGVITESKSGRQAILSKIVIDTTGDGDVAAFAGAKFEKGRERDGKTQAMTLTFKMGGVDSDKLVGYVSKNKEEFREFNLDLSVDPPVISIGGFKSIIERAVKNKDLFINHEILWIGSLIRKGEMYINWTHLIDVDGLNVNDLTYAEIEGVKQVIQSVDFLKRYIPGFESSYLMNIANSIGVRETRRIVGEYTLTKDDLIIGKKFENAIARNSIPIDIHSPDDEKQSWINVKSFDIPYSCLIPKNIDDLLIGGRCISATHEAMGSIRFEPCCMVTGQAAGTASAIAVKDKAEPRNVDIVKLQKILRNQGLID